jgi:hypothetical protein
VQFAAQACDSRGDTPGLDAVAMLTPIERMF